MTRRDALALLASTAAGWPSLARGQQARPVIGFIGITSQNAIAPRLAAFRAGLKENGFVEGQNLAIEYRYAQGQYDRSPALVADLLDKRVAVIVTAGGSPLPRAAMAATKTVPIVFTNGGDPVADGLVASLARPGGNATGATFFSGELVAKQFELLRELLPSARVIAILYPPDTTEDEQIARLRAAVRGGENFIPLVVGSVGDLDRIFATITERHCDAIIAGDPITNQNIGRVANFIAQNRIPGVFGIREFPAAGALMSYGASIDDTYRQVGIYAGRILKGAKPSDLPVVQPTKFELVINLKTAKALGLTIPPTLLARANEVIE
jgi:putative ABC transport system substrate-binding protein